MSALVIRLLTCDGLTGGGEVCPFDYGGDTDVASVEELREKATAIWGWHHTASGRDLCLSCWKERQR